MDRSRFKQYLAQIDTLPAGQREQLLATLKNPDHTSTIPSQVRERQRRLGAERTCIHCGATGVRKHGQTSNLIRFRCVAEGCGKTYTALTGSRLAKMRHRAKWALFRGCLRAPPCMKRHSDAEFATSPRSAGAIACSPTYATLNSCAGWSRWTRPSSASVPKGTDVFEPVVHRASAAVYAVSVAYLILNNRS